MARGAAGRPSGLPAAPTRDWFVPWRTGKQIRNCCPPPLTKSWPAPVRYANFSVGPLVAPYPWTHVQGRWNKPQMGVTLISSALLHVLRAHMGVCIASCVQTSEQTESC